MAQKPDINTLFSYQMWITANIHVDGLNHNIYNRVFPGIAHVYKLPETGMNIEQHLFTIEKSQSKYVGSLANNTK